MNPAVIIGTQFCLGVVDDRRGLLRFQSLLLNNLAKRVGLKAWGNIESLGLHYQIIETKHLM